MKKILLIMSFTAAIFAAFEVSAKTANLGFQIGQVVAAEITSAPQDILNKNSFPYPLPAKPVYAAITIKFDKGRSVSPLDYSLTVGGITVPAISVAFNMSPFACSPDVSYPSEKDYSRMLFVLDGAKIKLPAPGKTLNCTLRTNIRGRSHVALNLLSLGSNPFTDCRKIPTAGALK